MMAVLGGTLLIGSFFVLWPVSLQAQTPEQAQKLEQIEKRGLVPCGRSDAPGTPSEYQKSCELCDIFKLAKNITDYVAFLGFFVTAAAIGIGGFMIMIGGTMPSTLEQGKKVMTAGIVGLLIILFAWFIVDLSIKVMVGNVDVKSIISGGGGAGGFRNIGPWNSFKCEELKL